MALQHGRRGRNSARLAAGLLAVVVALALTVPTASAHQRHRGRHSQQGDTFARLAVEWWRRAVETPAPENPFGAGQCETNQRGHIWFLVGSLVGDPDRSCTMPRGTSLFFPLANNFYGAFLNDPAEQRTPEFVFAHAECAVTEFAVEVDGRSLRHPRIHRVSPTDSGLFDLQLPTDNVFGFLEKDVPDLRLSPSAQSGSYVLLKPLRPGTHTLHWTATSSCAPTKQDIRYTITVTKHRSR
jgi:methionine-rich copper-binding protein CopC